MVFYASRKSLLPLLFIARSHFHMNLILMRSVPLFGVLCIVLTWGLLKMVCNAVESLCLFSMLSSYSALNLTLMP